MDRRTDRTARRADTRAPLRPADARRRGSVFLLAVWSLFFLAAIAVAVGAHVSANVRMATALRERTRARFLARAGAWHAIAEVTRNPTNWQGIKQADLAGDPARFRDNDSLGGGTFTVWYACAPEDGAGVVVTNFGVVCEGAKININRASQDMLARAFRERGGLDESSAGRLAAAAVLARQGSGQDRLTAERVSRYSPETVEPYTCRDGRYRVIEELLLLDEFRARADGFARIETFATVYERTCFRATSVGRVGDEADAVECAIAFVFDKFGTILYWHER